MGMVILSLGRAQGCEPNAPVLIVLRSIYMPQIVPGIQVAQMGLSINWGSGVHEKEHA